ncbi:MAG TPA: DUF2252 domain-containing protein [Acidisarcina sp.]
MKKQIFTPEQRIQFGQARRKQLPRMAHGQWKASDRRHDPMKLLEESMRGRVPSLVALKYERMACSPFGFFRGAVPVMAADLAVMPNTTIHCQLCGDAHVRNLGAYAGSDGRLVFDINDFDETIHGPFEWDLKRLATSLVLAGREDGVKASASKAAVLTFARQYRRMVRIFAEMPVIDLARYQIQRIGRVATISQVLLKAERATPLHSLMALTVPAGPKGTAVSELGNGGPRLFREARPLLFRLRPNHAREVIESLVRYRESLQPERQHFFSQYRPVDLAFKIVGTGSVGLRDYVIYFEGNGPADPLFLQVKEEPASAYARYLGAEGTAEPAMHHQGRRVVDGQRAMQFQSDPFLGWTSIGERDYLVRQLNDHKGSIEVEDLSAAGLVEYAKVCGELLARGHSRSGDPCVLAGYLGNGAKFDEALASFAAAYADQTEADWKTLRKTRHLSKAAKKQPPSPTGK